MADRIDGLDEAARSARGRLDDALVDEAAPVAERAGARLRLSGDHTVVALAGATGSGKSSTFNAVTGLELAAIGVRRPTTSWTMACTWGADGAAELLDWLGVPAAPPGHAATACSTQPRGDRELDGLVLLDLPDHDSTEVAHHVEVDRLVKLADLLVWVLDPQKYADAAIHDRYLRAAGVAPRRHAGRAQPHRHGPASAPRRDGRRPASGCWPRTASAASR